MSTLARLVAIQGVGFTPITLAIQGLIEQIQEEQRQQVYGSGMVASAPAPDPLLEGRPIVQDYSEDDLIRKVTEKWEAIEAARAQDVSIPDTRPAQRVQRAPEYVQVVPDQAPNIEPVAPNIEKELVQAALLARKRSNEEALFMALLELA